MIKRVVLRTHGGLGNQLFQILYARLYSEQLGAMLFEIHDDRYRHKFARSAEISNSERPRLLQRAISAARLPKLSERLLRRPNHVLNLLGSGYADGYFQHQSYFADFDRSRLSAQIERLALELRVDRPSVASTLFHVRLGDFFSADKGSLDHALERLRAMPEGSYLMTNDERILARSQVAAVMRDKAIRLVETEGLAAEEVIRQMARFEAIETNNSTLALWAAVLSGAVLTLDNAKLADCYAFFRTA